MRDSELFASDLLNYITLIIVCFLSGTEQSPVFVLMTRPLALFNRVTCSCSLCKHSEIPVFGLLQLSSSPSIVQVPRHSQLITSLVVSFFLEARPDFPLAVTTYFCIPKNV